MLQLRLEHETSFNQDRQVTYSTAEYFNGPDNLQNCLLVEDLYPSNTWFLWPTQVIPNKRISIGSAIFAELTNVTNRKTDRQTNRQTDHATPSV